MVRFNPINLSMIGKNGFPTYPAGKVPALTIVADS